MQYTPVGKDAFGETYTTDLSIGGIAFSTPTAIPRSIHLKFKIRTSEFLSPLEFIGVVTRCDREKGATGFVTAIRLLSASDEDWERLVEWTLTHQISSKMREKHGTPQV